MPNHITLKTITTAAIGNGGYMIQWEAVVPKASTIFLCVVSRDNRVDVTHGYNRNKLPRLLAAIDAVNSWGTSLDCLLTAENAGVFVTESNAQPLPTPV